MLLRCVPRKKEGRWVFGGVKRPLIGVKFTTKCWNRVVAKGTQIPFDGLDLHVSVGCVIGIIGIVLMQADVYFCVSC